VKQKLFKLKEAVHVFRDESQSVEVATIKADRIIDWSASYGFIGADGQTLLGGVRRKGFRSLWSAHYEVFDANHQAAGTIRETNPMVKVLDGLLENIPVVGIFTGYLFHPKYTLTSANGTPLLQLQKRAAFFEGRYSIEQLTATDEVETQRNLLALLMLILLERNRG
jgi:hypothetical protein